MKIHPWLPQANTSQRPARAEGLVTEKLFSTADSAHVPSQCSELLAHPNKHKAELSSPAPTQPQGRELHSGVRVILASIEFDTHSHPGVRLR